MIKTYTNRIKESFSMFVLTNHYNSIFIYLHIEKTVIKCGIFIVNMITISWKNGQICKLNLNQTRNIY